MDVNFFLKFSKKYNKKNSAFTTLELMMVIATIAILASLILPTFSKVKRSMHMNQSKIQFSRYVFGLNAYYREYGCFPQIAGKGAVLPSESVVSLSGNSSADLIRALSGKEIDGVTPLTTNSYLNPNGVQFAEFSDDDFAQNDNGTINRGLLSDRFNNSDIKLVVESDSDDDALIPQSVFSSYATIKEKVPAMGLREKVAIFTVGDNDKSIDVVSWKTE